MKLPDRRQFLQLATGAAALPAISQVARAQTYPSRPVRIIVGFAPGASNDILARLMGQWLSDHLGQAFLVGRQRRANVVEDGCVLRTSRVTQDLINKSTDRLLSLPVDQVTQRNAITHYFGTL